MAIPRTWTSFEDTGRSPFVLTTWNHLADGLDVNGGFSVDDPSILVWRNRYPGIVDELKATESDIICLQEANHCGDLAVEFKDFAMLCAPKMSSAATEEYSFPPDGTAMFIKRSKFDVLAVKILYLFDPVKNCLSNQNAIIVCLQDKQENSSFIVATVHLKAKPGEANSTLRSNQIKETLEEINSFKLRLRRDDIPVVLCGDFNCNSSEKVYSTMLASSLQFSSAYNPGVRGQDKSDEEYATGEPDFTTWKYRVGKEKKETIDFIWKSESDGKLLKQAIRDIPSSEELGLKGLPCMKYPSDHISLSCRFAWR